MTDISDERLTAYLDGALDQAEMAELSALLERDAALAARLASLQLPMDALAGDAAQLLRNAPAMPELPQAAPNRSRGLIAASLVAGLLIGGVATRALAPSEPDWVGAIASYQALYVPQTLAGAPQDAAATATVLAAYPEGPDLNLEHVRNLPGLTFKRAQMLGFEGAPLLQLAYVTDTGAPVALCLVAVDDADRMARATRSHGLNAVDWVDGGTGFVIVGEVPDQTLLDLQAAFTAPT